MQFHAEANEARDGAWLDQRHRELLRATITARRSTFLSNLGAWMLILLACAMLPNARDFIFPLALRLATMMTTIALSTRLHRRIEEGANIDRLMRGIALNLFFVGASWALLLIPILNQEVRLPVHAVVGCGVFIVVGSVLTSLSALRGPFLAFALGVFLPIAAELTWRSGSAHIEVIAAFVALFVVILGYCRAAGQHRIVAADALVDNRRMSAKLAAMLEQAEYDALHDPLTGLYNRRALFQSHVISIEDRRRKHVLLVDLDHFKQLNDQFGHETGDKVLTHVAGCFEDVLSSLPGDEHFAVRLGGEEFAVVLFLSDPEKAHEIAERVRFMVALTAGRIGLAGARTTASIGLTHFDCGERIDDVFARADKAMYRAKSSGRNQVRRHAA